MNTLVDRPAATSVQTDALDAARAGLDFLVRHQVCDGGSADCGRLAFCFDVSLGRPKTLTTNWTTGIGIEALLAGYSAFGNEAYREAAGRAVNYLKSLQYFGEDKRVYGVFREVTPQSNMAHPRDALTAAWAMLDWSVLTGDAECRRRAEAFADWFITVGMERGYPYWTVRFDGKPWEPLWCGSFHSGSAFFLYRMFAVTGDARYRSAMRQVLDFYNRHHLDAEGNITVIRDRDTLEPLDGHADGRFSNRGWEMMHVYNDDFGALANLAAWKVEGEAQYLDGAHRFLMRMLDIQRPDGGFGPADKSVPSGAAGILVELCAAAALGHRWATQAQFDRVARYLMSVQIRSEGDASDGAFLGLTDDYVLDQNVANIRAGAYAIMALLRYAGVRDDGYFFDVD